tara:strand:- start:360 stop:857 length:498 start_codon:yes stop_codon:yes gene_type:complete
MKEDHKKITIKQNHQNSILKNSGLIVGGITGLLIGGSVFINSAENLAALAGLSEAFIGLAIAALATSLPEIVTSITAAVKRHGQMAVGNILGSNIFNILFVLGFSSILKPISINKELLAFDGMILLFIVMVLILFASSQKRITRKEGITMVLIYLAYFAFLIWRL